CLSFMRLKPSSSYH
ncbi:hypothetical protein Tsp_09798, partial [Trichinella spiralis]